ncbi:MAG TPA: ATP-binding protein [Candidatus Polarisedimenticolia bacterium]|nr:ATP-binding protein [Candidatus Polarisedimenticolia bacterium]
MYSPSSTRLRVLSWVVTFLLPAAAWSLARYSLSYFHPGVGVFFIAAACISAVIGGLPAAIAGALLNTAALVGFSYLYQPEISTTSNELWAALLIAVALVVGLARQKWSAAEMVAGRLSTDLARLRDELESQRSDLKRFHDLSVRLSSNLELQRLLNDVLTSIAALQKTDLAMLLLLPERSSKTLEVATFAGFTEQQIKSFGELPASFFSPERRVLIEDIEKSGTYFPFVDAATGVGFRSVFSMPIVNTRGDALGVVVTFFRKPHTPSDRQSRLVELYARQAANALDNARLYHDSLQTLAVEQQRTAVLRSLAEASVKINSVFALDSLLQVITDQARNIIGARQALTTLLPRGAWNHSITCVSVAEGQAALEFAKESSEMFMLACNLNKPVRLNAGARANAWGPVRRATDATRYGWLAAPLLTRDGRNLGLIQLSQKLSGEFSPDDEAILVQLTHMASAAIDNVRLYREAQEQIAETRRAQEMLERGKESMQLAQQYVGIGIWEWDLQTGELAWSDEIRRLHGIEVEKFDGRYESWMESIVPEDRQQVHQSITNALASNSEYEVQYRVYMADKSLHWLEARGRIIVMSDLPVRMLGVAMDVTSRKAAEQTLRQSEKIAATGRLAASIAHEINNPLASVMNALYILRTNSRMPESALIYVKTAEEELARVVHITKQTLGFYREISSPVMSSVPQLFEEVLAAYDARIEQGRITIHRDFNEVGPLAAFPSELRQVFSNLVLNAIEAISAPGNIHIRVRHGHDGQGRAGIRVTVADDGCGIPAENMPQIFEPFFSTKDSKGTGLGLWVSQGIVQKHQGSLRVRSRTDEVRHGTCCSVFLPFATNEATAEDELLTSGEQAPDVMSRIAGSGNDRSAA